MNAKLPCLCALAMIIAVGCSSSTDDVDSANPGTDVNLSRADPEIEGQGDPATGALYARAYEAMLWAGPAVAVMAQVESGHRDLGAGPYDIIYTGQSMDYRWGGITYNNQSPYWLAGFSVKDGPVVVEIPPAREDMRFFGSIHDVWWLPLEDFGPAGADEGEGGKYLVLPPDYEGEIPDGYIPLHSGSYINFIPGRTILRDSGEAAWADAVEYIKTVRIYPLASAAAIVRVPYGSNPDDVLFP